LSPDNKARYLIAATDVVNSIALRPNMYKRESEQALKFPLLGEEPEEVEEPEVADKMPSAKAAEKATMLQAMYLIKR
jgi:hypothetical protein